MTGADCSKTGENSEVRREKLFLWKQIVLLLAVLASSVFIALQYLREETLNVALRNLWRMILSLF